MIRFAMPRLTRAVIAAALIACTISPVVQPPTEVSAASSVNQWHSVALRAGWPESKWPFVRCVIARESGGNPMALNLVGRDRSYGLMQLNTKGYLWNWYTAHGLTHRNQLLNGFVNLKTAWKLYREYPRSWGRCRGMS